MSIYCANNSGIYAYGLGNQDSYCNSMREIKYYPITFQKIFDNFSDILPNNMKDKIFTLKEVEDFKILIENKKQ